MGSSPTDMFLNQGSILFCESILEWKLKLRVVLRLIHLRSSAWMPRPTTAAFKAALALHCTLNQSEWDQSVDAVELPMQRVGQKKNVTHHDVICGGNDRSVKWARSHGFVLFTEPFKWTAYRSLFLFLFFRVFVSIHAVPRCCCGAAPAISIFLC